MACEEQDWRHPLLKVWKEYFKVPPARTTVGTTGLLVKDTLVEIDLIGFVPGKNVSKQAIKSAAPQPLANYTEAFKVGGLVFAAGQLASDFKSGVPAQARRHPSFPYYSSDIKLQTRFVLDNLKRTFEAAGGSLREVVKAQVFLTDLNNFNGFDEVWKEYFEIPPARTTVGTTGLLVRDTLVEIDLIGVAPT
jgi:enamine deaminase RidA (YjgF/YER057c/UK114 family)